MMHLSSSDIVLVEGARSARIRVIVGAGAWALGALMATSIIFAADFAGSCEERALVETYHLAPRHPEQLLIRSDTLPHPTPELAALIVIFGGATHQCSINTTTEEWGPAIVLLDNPLGHPTRQDRIHQHFH